MAHIPPPLPGTAHSDAWWESVRDLLELGFPTIRARIDLAEQAGVRWAEHTTPFVAWEGDLPVAHVGVLRLPMVLDGEVYTVAGVHAVVTHPGWRGRGLARELLTRALAWAEGWAPLAKLHTDLPEVYRGVGFVHRPTWRFLSQRQGYPTQTVPLFPARDAGHLALWSRLLAQREPPSRRCATTDPGWLCTTVAALTGLLDREVLYLPEHDAIVVGDEHGPTRLVAEVIAPRLPPAEAVLGAVAPQGQPVAWTFPPDRFEPDATPSPAPPEQGCCMVRGPWPAAPLALSPLWEH